MDESNAHLLVHEDNIQKNAEIISQRCLSLEGREELQEMKDALYFSDTLFGKPSANILGKALTTGGLMLSTIEDKDEQPEMVKNTKVRACLDDLCMAVWKDYPYFTSFNKVIDYLSTKERPEGTINKAIIDLSIIILKFAISISDMRNDIHVNSNDYGMFKVPINYRLWELKGMKLDDFFENKLNDSRNKEWAAVEMRRQIYKFRNHFFNDEAYYYTCGWISQIINNKSIEVFSLYEKVMERKHIQNGDIDEYIRRYGRKQL